GETEELIKIMPLIKRMGVRMIAMTGRMNSTLARNGDAVLDVGVKEEACTLGLAPTASTTACLALGDALAVALLEAREFRAEDFANLHPAGSLGRKLMRVEELMHSGASMPGVPVNASMKEAVIEMTAKRMGLTGVFKGKRLIGVITDGDLRRAIESGGDVLEKKVADVMTRAPRMISRDSLAEAALKQMEEHSITSLFVHDGGNSAVGVVHMHDLVKAGVI
ncbi:MAG: KpsF/GutQ family sugar-phosphate isomerase, partial [Deltaproteobacteria bacterium]